MELPTWHIIIVSSHQEIQSHRGRLSRNMYHFFSICSHDQNQHFDQFASKQYGNASFACNCETGARFSTNLRGKLRKNLG